MITILFPVLPVLRLQLRTHLLTKSKMNHSTRTCFGLTFLYPSKAWYAWVTGREAAKSALILPRFSVEAARRMV